MSNLAKKASMGRSSATRRLGLASLLAASLIISPGMVTSAPALAQKAKADSLTYGELLQKIEKN